MIIKICSMLLSLRISLQKNMKILSSQRNFMFYAFNFHVIVINVKEITNCCCILCIDIFSGVSCDSCLKNNFRGRRYKCLICIDYDLCAACYESGATTNQHTTEHPMQCILSRSDFGESYLQCYLY